MQFSVLSVDFPSQMPKKKSSVYTWYSTNNGTIQRNKEQLKKRLVKNQNKKPDFNQSTCILSLTLFCSHNSLAAKTGTAKHRRCALWCSFPAERMLDGAFDVSGCGTRVVCMSAKRVPHSMDPRNVILWRRHWVDFFIAGLRWAGDASRCGSRKYCTLVCDCCLFLLYENTKNYSYERALHTGS